MSNDPNRKAIEDALLARFLDERDKIESAYERALGKLAIRFSLLHFTLEQFCWDMWGIKDRLALIMTGDLPTKHLVEKMRQGATCRIHSTKDRRLFISVLNKVEKAAHKRNDLLHALWIIRKDKPTICVVRKRGVLRGMDSSLLEEINGQNKMILEIMGEFEVFQKRRPLDKGPVEAVL